VCLVQAKYEHAVAAAQKSLAKDKHMSDDEEDDEDDSDQDQGVDLLQAKKKKRKRQNRPEETAADRAGKAAGHIRSVLKVTAPGNEKKAKHPKNQLSAHSQHMTSALPCCGVRLTEKFMQAAIEYCLCMALGDWRVSA